jgi:hypothetical protein
MRRRQGIELAGYFHGPNPIPAASRIGAGGVHAMDAAAGRIPPDLLAGFRGAFLLPPELRPKP